MDTGDADLDESFSGYIRVRTDFDESVMSPVKS
jgi:predicted polyphosphate/ATP-dependent NAD kinase